MESRNVTVNLSAEIIARLDSVRGELVSRHKILTIALLEFLDRNKGVKLEFERQ